jgi:uncharacterized protein YggE
MKRSLPYLSVCALLFFSGNSIAFADDASTRGITVTGECLKKIPQDRGAVTVASSFVAPTPRDAAQKAIAAHEKIKSAILSLKLADLQVETANYSVFQECSYSAKSERVCTGYRATLSTRFETSDIPSLGEIISTASSQGAQDVSDLEMFVSSAKLKVEREGCLEIATQNAKDKATRLAAGAGVTLGKILSLQEGLGDSPHFPVQGRMFATAKGMAASDTSAPSIDAKPVDLTVSVTATYGIQ